VRARNSPPIPASKVLGFRSRSEAEAFLAANGETTLGAVHFVEGPKGRLDYILQSSSTVGGRRWAGGGCWAGLSGCVVGFVVVVWGGVGWSGGGSIALVGP
jgi:hypothetical protein